MPAEEAVTVHPEQVAEEEVCEEKSYRTPLPLSTQVYRFVVVLLSTVVVLGAAIVITNERMPDPAEVRPLPDILLELIPKVAVVESGTDIIIFFLNATATIVAWKVYLLERHKDGKPPFDFFVKIPGIGNFLNRVVFGIIDSGYRPYPLKSTHKIMMIRFLTSYAVVMLFRSSVIVMTSYPATDNHCQSPQKIEHPVLNVFLTLVTLGSGAIHCGDLMFSGHTMILSVTFMLTWDYSPFLHRWALRVWCCILLPLSYYCILASRSHYTDDILVAMYVMIATYKLLDHDIRGAPWQLQLLIRWWPCLGRNTEEEATEEERNDRGQVVVIVTEDPADTAPGVTPSAVAIAEDRVRSPLSSTDK